MIAQIMGLPAVKLADDGALQMDEEDKSLRGMPNEAEIKRIETAAARLEQDPAHKDMSQNQRHGQLQKMIGAARVETFQKLDRSGKMAHLQALSAMGGGVMAEEEMAEQIVLEAEAAVLAAYPQQDANAMAEVKAKKHKELVADLTAKLKALPPDKKKHPRALMTKLADAVVGGPALGFYKKDEEVNKGGKHVSIDVQNARLAWIRRIATL